MAGQEINLNLGGGAAWKHEGWTNLEQDLGYDLALTGLSDFRDASVSRIFCSHALEHMPVEAARRLMRDCHRVLKPGGLLRLVLPDAEKFVTAWRTGNREFYTGNPCLPPHFESEIDCLMHMGGDPDSFERPSKIGHWFFWDRTTLTWLLVCAGFRTINDSSFGVSADASLRELATMNAKTGMPVRGFDNPLTKPISVYLEAIR